jgi:hypothetical protein
MDRITLIALLFSAIGCVPIDGGAVEASWVVATYDGRGIADCGCACPPIAKIRLQLLPVAGGSDPCAGRAACQFSCNLQSGATRFDIPAGSYTVSLVPVGADGNDITPLPPGGNPLACGAQSGVDPVVREVVKGQVTQLDAMLMQATCAPACGGSDSTRVCTK